MAAVADREHATESDGYFVAVNDIGLSIKEGEISGLAGPSSAGKMTLIEMIESLRIPDCGSIGWLSFNPTKEADNFQEKIGIQLPSNTKKVLNSLRETLTLPLGCAKLASSEVK